MRRSFLLIEVLVGLALLALLGVTLLRIQSDAVRQFHAAKRRIEIAQHVETMLGNWSAGREPVTLPATGIISGSLTWRRSVEPVRIDPGVIVPQVEVVVRDETLSPARELYRIAWLIPRKPPEKR